MADLRDYIPDFFEEYIYEGETEPANAAAAASSVDVSDGKAQFRVQSNGHIEVLSNEYRNKGKIFKPGDAVYGQVVKNLAAVSGNPDKLVRVLGAPQYTAAMQAPALPSSSGVPATVEDISTGQVQIPIYKRDWFLPAVVGGGALLAVGVILFAPKLDNILLGK